MILHRQMIPRRTGAGPRPLDVEIYGGCPGGFILVGPPMVN